MKFERRKCENVVIANDIIGVMEVALPFARVLKAVILNEYY